jgi:hypothetical protein
MRFPLQHRHALRGGCSVARWWCGTTAARGAARQDIRWAVPTLVFSRENRPSRGFFDDDSCIPCWEVIEGQFAVTTAVEALRQP